MSLLFLILASFAVCNGSTVGSLILDAQDSNLSVTVYANTSSELVTITITGPSAFWVGVGFGSAMMEGTYAVISDGGASDVSISEYILGYHAAGTVLKESFTVLSDFEENGVRRFQIQRGYKGYYSFPTGPSYIAVIWAFGPSAQPIYNTSTVMKKSASNTLKMTDAAVMQ